MPIDRTEAAALITERLSPEVVSAVTGASAALSTFPTIRLGNKVTRIPVQAALASAGFVDEGNAKPETEINWSNVYITAEEIAAISVVHENILADAGDSGFDIWGLLRPQIVSGIAKVIDAAVFLGTNKPASWPSGIVPSAVTAGNVVERTSANIDLELSQTLGTVEADGFDPNRWYTGRSVPTKLRDLRTSTGEPIYISTLKEDGGYGDIYGLPVTTVKNGAWPADSVAMALVGDTSKVLFGIRSDVTFRIFDTGTVGSVSLLEKDMVALRCTLRVGYVVLNPLTPENPTTATRYPFGILRDNTP